MFSSSMYDTDLIPYAWVYMYFKLKVCYTKGLIRLSYFDSNCFANKNLNFVTNEFNTRHSVTKCQLQTVSVCSLLSTAYCSRLTANYLQLTVNCLLFTSYCKLSTVHCQLLTVHVLLPTVYCQLLIVHVLLPTVYSLLSTAYYSRLIVNCL